MLLGTHLVQVLGVHAARGTGHIHAHKGHGGACALIAGSGLHGTGLCADKMRSGAGRVHKGGVALHFLEHLLVFLAGLHAGHAKGYDLNAAQLAPLGAQYVVQGLGQFHGVAGQGGVTYAHIADLGKGGLQGGHQLGFQLAVDFIAGVAFLHIAADIGVEQNGVGDAVAVLTEAADGNVDVDAGALIHHAEGHRAGRAVFVAHQLLGVEVIDALIHRGLAAEGKALADVLEHCADRVGQVAAEQRRRAAGVVGIFAGFGAHIHDLALFHDHGTLAVGNGHDRAVGDNVVIAFGVGAASALAFPAAGSQQVSRHGFTIKVFLPLVGHNAASSAHCSSDKSHNGPPISGAGRVRPILYR